MGRTRILPDAAGAMLRRAACFALALATAAAATGLLLGGIPNARATTFFQDGFDPPLPGWTTSEAWHLAVEGVDPCYGNASANHPGGAASSPGSMAYHFDSSPPAMPGNACTYDKDGGGFSVANAGNLTSPSFDLSSSGPVVWLHFATWREIEFGIYDLMLVFLDAGSGPVQVHQVTGPPSPQTSWETVHVDISAAADRPSVTVTFRFDTVDNVLNGFAGWYVDGVVVDDVSPTVDTLTFTPQDAAPAEVQPGTVNALMAWLNLTVDANSATVDRIRVDLTGVPPSDGDVSGVRLWLDGGDGLFDLGDDAVVGFGIFSGSTTTIPLLAAVVVTSGTPEIVWIAFDIASGATAGDFVGLRVGSAAYVMVLAPDSVACVGCPLDTYDGSKTRIGSPTSDNVTVTPRDLAPATVEPGASGVLMGGLDFAVDANSATVGDIVLNLTGLPPLDSDVGLVWLRQDNGDGTYDAATDSAIDAGFFSGQVVTLTANLSLAAGVPRRLWITFDIPAVAGIGDLIGLGLAGNSSVTVAAPDLVACAACPFDTYNGTKTKIVAPSYFERTFATPGWYLVSFPVAPADTSADAVLASLAGSRAIARSYDASSPSDPWKAHDPNRGGDLTNLDNGMGFWILITAPDTLRVDGAMPSSTTTIRLETGWNLVGFPSASTTYTVGDLKTATGATRVEGFDDTAGPYYLQVLPDSYAMTAGEGYWVYVPGPGADWNVPPT